MKKKTKLKILYSLVALIALVGITILWLSQVAIKSDTPQWLADTINNVTAFKDSINSTLVLTIGLIVIASVIIYNKTVNRKNSTVLNVGLIVLGVFAGYLLIAPGLAAAFPDQQWLVDFSTVATDINTFLNDNSAFIMLLSLGATVLFLGFKKLK